MKYKYPAWHYLPDDGSLVIEAAVPADKLIPRLSGYKDIVELIYKMLFQGLSLLVFNGGKKKKKRVYMRDAENNTQQMFCSKRRVLPENSPELSIGPG